MVPNTTDTMEFTIIVVLIGIIHSIKCQETSRAVLAPYLVECYSDPLLMNRNNFPPLSLPVLIDLVRKIEDDPATVGNVRQLSAGILHMFRQDGIIYDPNTSTSESIVPYSPTGFQTYKNRLLLTKLLPTNQFRFSNNSLASTEKCVLHHMVSSSIAMQSRGDEATVCPQIGVQPVLTRLHSSQYRIHTEVEVFDVNGGIDRMGKQIRGISNCPLENGVITTPWGTVAAGPLISGISSALESQIVLVSDLVRVKEDFIINDTVRVSNTFASTLAGDLAEAAMRQGTSRGNVSIGAAGQWNSTNTRKHYFLRKSDNLEITDAEIRGGMDGLILGDLSNSYINDFFPELKLSQMLDMYYSEKGTFHDSRFRACLRQSLITSVAPTATLLRETFGFSVALYTTMPLSGTLALTGLESLANSAVDNFYRYVAQSFNDTPCNINNVETTRPRINLILVCDPTIQKYPLISYILDKIEISKFGSSVTLLDPRSGDIIVETTFSIVRFHESFVKRTELIPGSPAVNMSNVLRAITVLTVNDLALETAAHYSGGNSTIALFLVDNVPMTSDEQRQINLQAAALSQRVPDLRLIFATSSASEDTLKFVIKDSVDFIPVTLTNMGPQANELEPVVRRLREIPRRIINPLCSHQWNDMNSGTVSFEDFVEVDGINLYSLHPNYFYQNNQNRAVRVEGTTYGPINVCYSRTDQFPRRNRTSTTVPPGVTCESVTAGSLMEIDLAGACDGYTSIGECPSLYISVGSTTTTNPAQCRDWGCRLPNDIKFSIISQQLGCYSSAINIATHKIFIYLSLVHTILSYSKLTLG